MLLDLCLSIRLPSGNGSDDGEQCLIVTSERPENSYRGRLVGCTSPQPGSPRARTDIYLVGISVEPGSTRAKSLPQPGFAETQKSAVFVGPGSPHASKH